MRKKKKHPKDMTTEELAKSVFHPKVLTHAKKHVRKLNADKPTPKLDD